MQVYLDNAATTQIDPEVISEITQFMNANYGNPSSSHSKGRQAKVELEKARKKISTLLGVHEKEIIFTSGGTEANNAVLKSLVYANKIERIISSPIEHHSILDTLDWIINNNDTEIIFLDIDTTGNLDIQQLELLLQDKIPTLVTLMHANNEIGNILNISRIGDLCKLNNALFHSDMVQTIGHLPINLKELSIDFASASAHKYHGPKGVGFLYINSKTTSLSTFMAGGSQERGIRGGTENISGVMGMTKALEISTKSVSEDQQHFKLLKSRFIEGLEKNIPQVKFNGNSSNLSYSLHNILNIKLPGVKDETLLFNLDIKGIYLSEGSACSSGATEGSHVINSLSKSEDRSNNIRISFSKFNTIEDVDYSIKVISGVVNS